MKLFRARHLLPITTPPIEDGALLVEEGRIIASGPFVELRQAAAELVDFGEAIILPPLVNAHTHLELTHFPHWAATQAIDAGPAPFIDWLQRVILIKRDVAPERFLFSLRDGIALSLAAGTGAVGDILSSFAARRAYQDTALRGRLFLETLGLDPQRNRELLQQIGTITAQGPCGHLALGVSPHSPYTLTGSYLEEVFAFADRQQLPAAIHLAEAPAEVAFLQESRGELAEILYPFVGWQGKLPSPAGLTPTAYLARCGGLGTGRLLVHGVQVTAADVALIAESGATVVLCPRSNAHLQVGRAPVELYLAAGVPLALGTDSLSSSDSLSIWDEMAFAQPWFTGQLSCRQLLASATVTGAAALGLEGEMGALAPGWGAHFQVLTPANLPSGGQLALEEFLCSPGRTAEVTALFLDGRDVLQKG